MTNLYFMIKYAVGYLILLFVFVNMEIESIPCTIVYREGPDKKNSYMHYIW